MAWLSHPWRLRIEDPLHPLSGLLLTAAALVVVSQIGFRLTVSASPWKGGGFGMYAGPHPRTYRVVVAELFHGAGGERIRLVPEDSAVTARVERLDGRQAERFRAARRRASRSRPFPTAGRAREVAGLLGTLIEPGLFGPGTDPEAVDSIVVSFHDIRPRLATQSFTTSELSRGVRRPR